MYFFSKRKQQYIYHIMHRTFQMLKQLIVSASGTSRSHIVIIYMAEHEAANTHATCVSFQITF